MPSCPQCTKPLAELTRRCPSCMADLDLLVEYVNHLQGGLEEARRLTRAGRLDEAVWAYLAVLEVEPDNAEAKRQVGRVATAVRAFDRVSPGRNWIARERGELGDEAAEQRERWLNVGFIVLLVLLAFVAGYGWGTRLAEQRQPEPPAERLGPPKEVPPMKELPKELPPFKGLPKEKRRDQLGAAVRVLLCNFCAPSAKSR